MPWCPKCKTEYREGFQVCADCGSKLVEELAEEMAGGESEEALDMGTGDFPEGEFSENQEEMWQPDQEEAVSADDFGETEEISPAARNAGRGRSGGLYQDSSERASDNRSSAWVLLGLGTAGLIVVILSVAGILPLRFGNPYLFYGVMSAIFILFVVAGIVSMKNAKLFEKKAESENSLRQTLLDWCGENLRAEEIDASVHAEGVSTEIAYFRRSSYIKERLNHQFINLNQGFLDQFIDDYIYDKIFGERTE